MEQIRSIVRPLHIRGYWLLMQESTDKRSRKEGYVAFMIKHEAYGDWHMVYAVNKVWSERVWSKKGIGGLVPIDLSTEEGIEEAVSFFNTGLNDHIISYFRTLVALENREHEDLA